jgi:hypothetical protein
MLLSIHPHEDLIDEEGISIAPVLPFQSSSKQSAEFDAPETNRFSTSSDTAFG